MELSQQYAPLGYGQLTASGTAALLSTAVQASFTASAVGNQLTTTSVAGVIRIGSNLNGTGAPAGTTIINQVSGPLGGAGVYTTSVVTTMSSASATTTGIPAGANLAIISVATANIMWRDDGGAPTTTVGMPIVAAAAPFAYSGNINQFSLIAVSGSPIVNVAFYRSVG